MNQNHCGKRAGAIRNMRIEPQADVACASIFNIFQFFTVDDGKKKGEETNAEHSDD